MELTDHARRVEAFRNLHESGCFVIPNPWDAGSAKLLEGLGFHALATTSAGFAFTRARPDAIASVSRDEVLAHVRDLVAATGLPISADFQNGYADEPDGVAANVAQCIATGAAGLSIEDATGVDSKPLYERELAIERVRAARLAIDATEQSALFTARCEAWLLGVPDARRITLDRLVAFADAGADCLFAPGVRGAREIAELVNAVAPKPLSVLVSAPSAENTVARLADLGVRRVSVGSALARVAWAAFLRSAREIAIEGTFEGLAGATPFAELNSAFRARS